MTTDQVIDDDLISELQMAVPTHHEALTPSEYAALNQLTSALVEAAGDVGYREFQRFQATRNRTLDVDPTALDRCHRDRTVVVTGGTGCIGGQLLAQLSRFGPRRLVSLSRGVTTPAATVDGVEYLHVDVRNRAGIFAAIGRLKPDIVYHLAAQHDPGLAEAEVARTLTTNVTGTANVAQACREHGVTIVHASTGKAIRPFTTDIYAGSGKLSEWVVAEAMVSGELVGAAARFAHVVDNSLIAGRFRTWSDGGLPIRLHSPEGAFYVQSAREAADQLMCAGLDAVSGEFRVSAIRDLGWPIALIDLAVGWWTTSSRSSPIYICGSEAAYPENHYPGLYDPHCSGGRSPLLSAIEAPGARASRHGPEVDLVSIAPRVDPCLAADVDDLGRAAAADASPAVLRDLLEKCAWSMLVCAYQSIPTAVLARQVDFVRSIPTDRFSIEDRQVVDLAKHELLRRRFARRNDSRRRSAKYLIS